MLEFLIGLLIGLMVALAGIGNVDISIKRINTAIAVCEQANSTLVSTDWTVATCANRAEIPFRVLK